MSVAAIVVTLVAVGLVCLVLLFVFLQVPWHRWLDVTDARTAAAAELAPRTAALQRLANGRVRHRR